ncbi:MAG: flagellar motor protein MotA [Alphaproteobacteria bacterium]|nr:flagellar motor protein MotA [Alphaproteobacteria bacterium]
MAASKIWKSSNPSLFLWRMVIFLSLSTFIAAILYPQIHLAFIANPGLNGLIIFTLLIGIIFIFRMVVRLLPEMTWVSNFRIADPGLEITQMPVLLAPMAIMLRERRGQMNLSTSAMRSMLDSVATRLDESREISRYLIGLLVFLGLLGTFWGLLDTVTSVGRTIASLDTNTGDSGFIFEELKTGLVAPLSGMGTAFSSSLLGLAGSLILGFLDLQAGQAQNRFYMDLEDWLSAVTSPELSRKNERDALTMSDPADFGKRGIKDSDPALQEMTSKVVELASDVRNLVRIVQTEQQIIHHFINKQADKELREDE